MLGVKMYFWVQAETEGDALLSCSVSPSGECLAFGGSGGYVHLWASHGQPSVNAMGQVGGRRGQEQGGRVAVGRCRAFAGRGGAGRARAHADGPRVKLGWGVGVAGHMRAG